MVLHDVPPRRPCRVCQKWKKVGLQDNQEPNQLFSGPFFSEKIDGTLKRAKINRLRNPAKKTTRKQPPQEAQGAQVGLCEARAPGLRATRQ